MAPQPMVKGEAKMPQRMVEGEAVPLGCDAHLAGRCERRRRVVGVDVEGGQRLRVDLVREDGVGGHRCHERASGQAPDVDRPDLDGTGLGLAVDALLLQRPGGWSAVLPLRLADDGQATAISAVRQALAGSGARKPRSAPPWPVKSSPAI